MSHARHGSRVTLTGGRCFIRLLGLNPPIALAKPAGCDVCVPPGTAGRAGIARLTHLPLNAHRLSRALGASSFPTVAATLAVGAHSIRIATLKFIEPTPAARLSGDSNRS